MIKYTKCMDLTKVSGGINHELYNYIKIYKK